MAARRIDLVCFDLGRVLIRICDGWGHACEAAKIAARSAELSPEAEAAMHGIVARNEVGGSDLATFCREAAPHLGLTAADVEAICNAYLREPFEGGAELIDELESAGVATACLSNTNANHWRMITTPGSPHYLAVDRMSHRFASHLVRARKPDVAIYEHVERESGVRPERIAFFDDLLANVEAARARGWKAHVITPGESPIEQARRWLVRYDVLPPQSGNGSASR